MDCDFDRLGPLRMWQPREQQPGELRIQGGEVPKGSGPQGPTWCSSFEQTVDETSSHPRELHKESAATNCIRIHRRTHSKLT